MIFFNNGYFRSHQDTNQWPVKDIKPEDGLFTVNDDDQVEFVLSELLPNKQYFLKTLVNVRDDNVDSGYQVNLPIDLLCMAWNFKLQHIINTTHVKHSKSYITIYRLPKQMFLLYRSLKTQKSP